MKFGKLTQLYFILVRGWPCLRPQTSRNCEFKPTVLFALLAQPLHPNSVGFQLGEQERNWGEKFVGVTEDAMCSCAGKASSALTCREPKCKRESLISCADSTETCCEIAAKKGFCEQVGIVRKKKTKGFEQINKATRRETSEGALMGLECYLLWRYWSVINKATPPGRLLLL